MQRQMHAVGLSSLPHNNTLLTSVSVFLYFFLCLCETETSVMSNLMLHSFLCIPLPVSLSFPLIYTFSLYLLSCLSIFFLLFSFLCFFVALFSHHGLFFYLLYLSLSLLLLLFSPFFFSFSSFPPPSLQAV